MNVVVIGTKKFTGPAGWDELTLRHVKQLLNWRVKADSNPAGKFVLLQLWYGIRYRHYRLLDDDQRVSVLELLDFLDERPERWILPILSVKARRYVGPGDGLDYLTFAEFMYAYAARQKYLDTGFAGHLSELVASLYRPRKLVFFQPSGDAGRLLFDPRTHAEQARKMAVLPIEIQQGVLMNFEGCMDRFPEQYPYLFKPSDAGGEGGSWLDVGLNLARQTSALGTFAQLEQTSLTLVLMTLDQLMKENQELKEKLDQQQP